MQTVQAKYSFQCISKSKRFSTRFTMLEKVDLSRKIAFFLMIYEYKFQLHNKIYNKFIKKLCITSLKMFNYACIIIFYLRFFVSFYN